MDKDSNTRYTDNNGKGKTIRVHQREKDASAMYETYLRR